MIGTRLHSTKVIICFQHADLAAVVMQEGLAFVCLITSAMTVDRAKIDVNIPKKGKADDTQRKKVSILLFLLLPI